MGNSPGGAISWRFAAWLAFSPDRCGEHPQAHLKSFHGTLQAQADVYASTVTTPATIGTNEASRLYAVLRFTPIELNLALYDLGWGRHADRIGVQGVCNSSASRLKRGDSPDARR